MERDRRKCEDVALAALFRLPTERVKQPSKLISANKLQIPDSVRVKFNDPMMFVGMNGLAMETKVLEKVLPQ